MWPFSRRPDDERRSTPRAPRPGDRTAVGPRASSAAASGPTRTDAPSPIDLPDDATVAQQLASLQGIGLHLRRGADHEDLQLRHAAASPRPENFQLLLLGAGTSLDRPMRELVVGPARPPHGGPWSADTLATAVRDTLATAEEALGSSGHVENVEADHDADAGTGAVRVTLGGARLQVPLEDEDLSPVLDALLAQLVPPVMVAVPLVRLGDDGARYRRLLVPKEHAQVARAIAVGLSRAPTVELGDLGDQPASAPTTTGRDGGTDAPDPPDGTADADTTGVVVDRQVPDDIGDLAPADSDDHSTNDAETGTAAPLTGPTTTDQATTGPTTTDPTATTPTHTPETRRRVAALVEAGLRLDPRLSVDDVADAVEPVADPADWDPFLDAVVTDPVRGRIPAWSNVYRFPPEDTMADSSDDWIAVVGDVARASGSWDRLSHAEVVYEQEGDLPAGLGLTLGGQRIRVEADVWGALVDLVAVARLCEALTPKGRSTVHLPNHAAWVTPRLARPLSELIGEY